MNDGHAAREALKKICSCPPFATAESLKNLLTFLVEQTLAQPGEPIRESQIAIGLFHKGEDFDPRQDSTVRVQTSRLRAKLNEYYAAEGALDPWILELPRGSYSVTWKERGIPAPATTENEIVPKPPLSPWVYAGGGFALGVAVTLMAVLLAT